MDYVRSRMQQFVENAEIDNMMANPVFKKQRPTIRRMTTVANNQAPNFTPDAETLATTSSAIPEPTIQLTPV